MGKYAELLNEIEPKKKGKYAAIVEELDDSFVGPPVPESKDVGRQWYESMIIPEDVKVNDPNTADPFKVEKKKPSLAETIGISPDIRQQWKTKGPIKAKEQWSSEDWREKVPFSPAGLIKITDFYSAVQRLQNPKVYDEPIPAPGSETFSYSPWNRGRVKNQLTPEEKAAWKQKDEDIVGTFLLEQAEREERGTTIGADIVHGITELPAYMGEFLATGGGASIAKKAVFKAMGKYAKNRAAAMAAKGAEWLAAGAARTAMMPHRVGEKTVEELLPQGMELTEKGDITFKQAGEKPWTALFKGFGDIMIENLSETAGPTIGKVAGKILPKRIAGALRGAWKKMHPSESINKLATAVGYHGFIEEMGEESLGDVMRWSVGLNSWEDLVASHSGRAMLTKAGIIAVPSVASAVPGIFSGKQVQNVSENVEGMVRPQREGEEPGGTIPEQETGGQKAQAGGILQETKESIGPPLDRAFLKPTEGAASTPRPAPSAAAIGERVPEAGEAEAVTQGKALKTVEDVKNLISEKSKEYGSKNEYLASDEYKTIYPEIKEIYAKAKQVIASPQSEHVNKVTKAMPEAGEAEAVQSGGIPEQQAAQPTAGPPVVGPLAKTEATPGEKAAVTVKETGKSADPQITTTKGTVSEIVREPISAGTEAGNKFLARTKGTTKIGPPGVLRKIASGTATFVKEFHFLDKLPKTEEFGDVREKFRQAMEIGPQAEKDTNLAYKKALKPLGGTALEMTKRGQAVELKLIADDLYESVVQGTELPPSGMTKDDIVAMKKEADALYEKYPTVKESYNLVREEVKKLADMIVEQGWFPAEKMKNFYLPHKVLKYLRSHDDYFGVSNKPFPPKKAYLRKRKGGVDYATDVLERLRQHGALVRRDVAITKFLDATLKNEQAEHFDKEFPEWDRKVDAMPEGYEEYTLLPPRFYYSIHGVTEDLAMALLEHNLNTIEDILLEPSAKPKVRKILGVEKLEPNEKKRSYIVRSPIAAQLAEMPTVVLGDNGIYKAIKAGNTFIKGQILFNPLYAIPFHTTNFMGDGSKVLVSLPSALGPKYIIGYLKEVMDAVRGNPSVLFHKSQTTGVVGAGWIGTELGRLEPKIKELKTMGAIRSINGIKRLWNIIRDIGAGREDLLRFATFSRLVDLQNQGEDIIKYAIKDVDAVRGIKDPYDKAAKIARDIMGDYSAIGKSGRMLSDLLIPFYRWMHLNTPWWPRMLKEYAKKGQYGRIAYAIAATLSPYILASIWNYSDEDRRKTERSLPPWRRWTFHIVTGKDKVVFSLLPFDDILNFFDIPESISDFQRYSRGMINIKELIMRVAINTAKGPPMTVINSIGGVASIIRNAIGLQTFPEIKPYLVTGPKQKAINILKGIFGAPGQLAEAYLEEGQEQKRKDLLWRSVIPFFRPWTNDIYKAQEQYEKSTYQRTDKKTGAIKGEPHKGEKRNVDILKIRLEGRLPSTRKKVPKMTL